MRLALPALAFTTLTGCLNGHYVVIEDREGRHVTRTVGGFAAAAIETQERRRREVELDEARRSAATPLPEGTVLAGMNVPERSGEHAAARPIDAAAATRELAAVDFASCPELEPGYVRARVVFAGNGHVRSSIIDAPSRIGSEARHCIHTRLAVVEVPPFDGFPVTMTRTWYVRPVNGR